jgi:hypothetical protein
MQEALRKTVELLRQRPALLLPLVFVSWTAYYLQWFQKAATHFVLHRFLIGHSVLGFSVPAPDPTYAYVHKAMLIMLPFSLAMSLLMVSVYVGGFLLTARLVRELFAEQRLDWVSTAQVLRQRAWHVLGFSLSLFVLFAAIGALVAAAADSPLVQSLQESYGPLTMVRFTALLVVAVMAWIMTPFGQRLMADSCAAQITKERKLWGRLAAIACAVLSLSVSAYITGITPQINFAFADAALLRSHLVWPLITFVCNLPLGALWIFIAVLQFSELDMVDVPSPS